MRLFGFEITKAVPTDASSVPVTIPGDRGSWWWPIVREPYTGAWQRNDELRLETILVYSTVFACVTLIASDVGKIGLRLVEEDSNGIWVPKNVPAFSPVLRKPNRYQTRIKFIESWVSSKLIHGNTYVLKERDDRGVVVALYVLDPTRVKVLVAPDGAVYYDLYTDNLAGIEVDKVAVPASEIIHDTMICLYHPLVGVSPMTACAIAATQGLAIQRSSAKLFRNGAVPGGIISAPGPIKDDQAQRIKDYWERNYTGENVGKVAVLGDGLTYSQIAIKAEEAQLIEQLKWTSESVCSVFHVPPFMVGVGPMPSYNNVEALNQQYYSQCLQTFIESIELSLDEGLGLTAVQGKTYGTEFDLEDLLRMDTATKVKSWSDLVKGAIASPNEARFAFNLAPVAGGETPLAQQQNYSLEALAKRDARDDPFGTAAPEPESEPEPEPDEEEEPDEDEEKDKEEGEDEKSVLADLVAIAAAELRLRLFQPGIMQ